MNKTIIDFGKSILLDGVRLGTASVIGDFIARKTKRLFGSDDTHEEKKQKEKETRSQKLVNWLDNKD